MFFTEINEIKIGRFKNLSEKSNIFHCTSTRRGGVSSGVYSSLNIGFNTGDNDKNVHENRRILLNTLGIDERNLAVPEQIHSANIEVIEKGGFYDKCDGLITDRKGVVLSIQTADCIPLFLFDHKKIIVGLIHAGWRGIQKGIVIKSVDIFTGKFGSNPKHIQCFIGPSIRKCCYQVKENVASHFSNAYIIKGYLDLVSVVKEQLFSKKILKGNVFDSKLCTSCYPEFFYSYRRDNGKTGRMVSLITITG